MDMQDQAHVSKCVKTLNENELREIDGGSLTGTIINALTSAAKVVLDIGRSLGSALRRISEDKKCAI